jgi:hypothetical protein
VTGMQHGWPAAAAAGLPPAIQQQQQYMYPPYAYGSWYPFHAYGLPGMVPPAAAAAAAGLGLGLRRGGSGHSRHRPAAMDLQGRTVRHGVLQRSHSL